MSAPFVLAAFIFLISAGLWLGVFGILQPIKQTFLDISGSAQKWLEIPFAWTKDIWSSYIALRDIKTENESLKHEIERLQREIASYKEAVMANARYKRLLDIKNQEKIPVVAASVIGEDLAPWVWSLTIDKGIRDSVGPEMPVLADDGIIGQVVESSDRFSKVLLIADQNSAVAAIDQRSRTPGILKGNGDGLCRLAYVGKEEDVAVGDEVITSGTDQIFPKGLPLGKIIAVDKGSGSDLFQTVTVKPAAGLKKAEDVLVQIRGKPLVEGLH
ncbi:MAG: rod shape-determining protein MreC [Dissulfurimicrobium sp.]